MHPPALLLHAVMLLFLLSAGVTHGVEPAAKLLPVDEAAKNPSFFIFRARLQEALAKHDVAHLLSVTDPKIQIGFGGDDGIEAFKKDWKLNAPNSSELWSTLGRALALGGKFMEEGDFQAPYVCAAWPEKYDAFDYVAIVGENVRLRAQASATSAVVASLSFDVVHLVESSAQSGKDTWTKVRLMDGREGYVSDAFLGRAVGYRAYFSKKDGSWKMTAFLAGD